MLTRDNFIDFISIKENEAIIKNIAKNAAQLHDICCNQKYDGKPYSFHLNMVATFAMDYCHFVCFEEKHIIPIIFGAYFHDAIEDARMTYNDILKLSAEFMDKDQSIMATEIVYALTDEKGRNRAERGNNKHYEDIRNTLYAPFVKWCDRMANAKYSIEMNSRMSDVYRKEMPEFVEKIGGSKYIGKELCDLILKL